MNDILMYIIAIVIVAVIAGIIIFEMKGQKNGDKQVQDFLESIKDSLLKVIANQINTFNLGVLKDKDSLENFEKQFMESIYSSAINVTLEQLEAIKASRIVVVLNYGRTETTSGTTLEQGLAYAFDKLVILVEMTDNVQSLMVANARYATVKGLEGLESYDFEKLPKLRTDTEVK